MATWKWTGNCSRALLFFIITSTKRLKTRTKQNFGGFSKILFQRVSWMQSLYFKLFTKIKYQSVPTFWCTFSAYFLNENFLYIILYVNGSRFDTFPNTFLKDALSVWTIFGKWNPLKNDKKWFLFHLKNSFCFWLFGNVEKLQN